MKNEVFADLGSLNNATIGIKTPVQSNAVSISNQEVFIPVQLFFDDLDAENMDPNTLHRPRGLVQYESKANRQLRRIEKRQQTQEAKDANAVILGDGYQKESDAVPVEEKAVPVEEKAGPSKRKAGPSKRQAKKFKATNTQSLVGSNEDLSVVFKDDYAAQIASHPILQDSYADERRACLNNEYSLAEYQFSNSFFF